MDRPRERHTAVYHFGTFQNKRNSALDKSTNLGAIILLVLRVPVYGICRVIVLPAELSAAAVLINYWILPSRVNNAAWISICIVVVVVINSFGARAYGECEFWFASIKVITITGLIVSYYFSSHIDECDSSNEKFFVSYFRSSVSSLILAVVRLVIVLASDTGNTQVHLCNTTALKAPRVAS